MRAAVSRQPSVEAHANLLHFLPWRAVPEKRPVILSEAKDLCTRAGNYMVLRFAQDDSPREFTGQDAERKIQIHFLRGFSHSRAAQKHYAVRWQPAPAQESVRPDDAEGH